MPGIDLRNVCRSSFSTSACLSCSSLHMSNVLTVVNGCSIGEKDQTYIQYSSFLLSFFPSTPSPLLSLLFSSPLLLFSSPLLTSPHPSSATLTCNFMVKSLSKRLKAVRSRVLVKGSKATLKPSLSKIL